MLVGSVSTQAEEDPTLRQVSKEQAIAAAKKLKNVITYFECNMETKRGVKQIFDHALLSMLVPEHAIKLYNVLEVKKEKEKKEKEEKEKDKKKASKKDKAKKEPKWAF